MGYDLYITRARDWFENKSKEIDVAEWAALVDSDPSLVRDYDNWDDLRGVWWKAHPDGSNGFFYYDDGNVVIKSPDEPSIDKMVEMAGKLNARVQGQDGETYSSGSVPPRQRQFSKAERVALFLGRLKKKLEPRPKIEYDIHFKVGDRVRDQVKRCEGVVVSIDPNVPLGKVVVKYDDGKTVSWALAAHPLDRIE